MLNSAGKTQVPSTPGTWGSWKGCKVRVLPIGHGLRLLVVTLKPLLQALDII